jgi:hypothetical protein
MRASEGTLSRGARLHLQSLAPTNPRWASVGYGPFSCVIHKLALCPSSGDINRLMMMVTYILKQNTFLLIQTSALTRYGMVLIPQSIITFGSM